MLYKFIFVFSLSFVCSVPYCSYLLNLPCIEYFEAIEILIAYMTLKHVPVSSGFHDLTSAVRAKFSGFHRLITCWYIY